MAGGKKKSFKSPRNVRKKKKAPLNSSPQICLSHNNYNKLWECVFSSAFSFGQLCKGQGGGSKNK